MIFSKVMRMSDWEDRLLSGTRGYGYQVELIAEVVSGGWDPVQHPHRRWEYAMMLAAYHSWKFWRCQYTNHLLVADVGCGIGLSPALMLRLGNDVVMYEPWVYGDESAKAIRQVEAIKRRYQECADLQYMLLNRPLCELVDADKERYDVALCISTLEHIGEYMRAWHDLLSMVKQGGLVFITTDFAEDQQDHYRHANLRAGRMFTKEIYEELEQAGRGRGFRLLPGPKGPVSDWEWSEECRIVNDYGFACLAMVRSEA